jgi:hypothetical protein
MSSEYLLTAHSAPNCVAMNIHLYSLLGTGEQGLHASQDCSTIVTDLLVDSLPLPQKSDAGVGQQSGIVANPLWLPNLWDEHADHVRGRKNNFALLPIVVEGALLFHDA